MMLVITCGASLFTSQGDLCFLYVLKHTIALLPWSFSCTTITWTQHWSTTSVGSNLKLWPSSWRIRVVLLEPCPREMALTGAELGAPCWLTWASLVHSTAGSSPAASAPLFDLPREKGGEERGKKEKQRNYSFIGGLGMPLPLTVAENKHSILCSTRARRQQEKCIILCLVW